LLVDEINRGDTAKIFGELLYALEYRDEPVTTPYAIGGDPTLTVPRNLLVLGSMNTADQSIAMVDKALRRRFAWLTLRPERSVVKRATLPETRTVVPPAGSSTRSAFALTRHFPARDVGAYVLAQVLGAATAALCLLAVWPDAPADLGATVPSIGAGGALLYEVLLTALLMFVITAVATDVRAVGSGAALAIGGAVALDALFGGPVTGASMNPARSLGPAAGRRRVDELLGLRRGADRRRRARRVRLSADSRGDGAHRPLPPRRSAWGLATNNATP